MSTTQKKPYRPYTVNLSEEGFPVYFVCPFCPQLHSYPEEKKADFETPAEACLRFTDKFLDAAIWYYIPMRLMLILLDDTNG
jgi:hypothetical protein